MFAKRDPVLRDVITFSDDPYNAVGSFGVIVRMLIALLSFLRAFPPYREAPSMAQQVYLVRFARGGCPRRLHHPGDRCCRYGPISFYVDWRLRRGTGLSGKHAGCHLNVFETSVSRKMDCQVYWSRSLRLSAGSGPFHRLSPGISSQFVTQSIQKAGVVSR